MEKNRANEKQLKINLNVKSTIHPAIFHPIRVDLRCYERMPKQEQKNLYCYEQMPDEGTLKKKIRKNFKQK